MIGRPKEGAHDPNGDWVCPLLVEGFTNGVILAHGVGPVDALANALAYVRGRFAVFSSVEPRADPSRSTPE